MHKWCVKWLVFSSLILYFFESHLKLRSKVIYFTLKTMFISDPSPLIGGMRELGLMGYKSSIDIISDHPTTLKDFVKLAVGGGG